MERLKKINLILVYSIPIFLVISHSIADFIFVFVGISFLIFLSINKLDPITQKIFKDKVIISFFLFYIFLLLSSIFSEFFALSIKRSLPYLRFIIFIIALKYWLLTDKKSLKILYLSISSCLIFVCFDVLFQFYNYHEIINESGKVIRQGFDIFGYASNPVIERFQGPFKDEFIAGSYILKLSPFLFLTILNTKMIKKKNILVFIFVTLIIYSIYITGDRAPFFILLQIFLIIPFFFNKRIILLYLSSIILITYFAGLNSDKKQRYIYDALGAIGFKNNEFTLDTGYGHLFYSAIKIWLDKPILGAGTKNYRKICERDEYNFETQNKIQLCSTHPHNYVLELLSETGIIGLILFYLILVSLIVNFRLLKKLIRRDLKYLEIKLSFMSLILILWPLSTTGSILTNKNSILLWFVFGILYSLMNFENDNQNKV